MAADLSGTSAAALPKYVEKFRDFERGAISAADFESWYLATYLKDPTPWEAWVFDILDRVFADADAYVENDDDRPGVIGGIDAQQLRQSVRSALAELGG